jgi:hypothetical protein
LTEFDPFDNTDFSFDNQMFDNYYLVKFFEKITRTILVKLDDKTEGEQENTPVRVIFTIDPLVHNLSQHTRDDFLQKVNRDGRYIKLYSLMQKSDQFYDEIKYNSERSNKVLIILRKIDFYWFEMVAFFIAFIVNVYLIITLDQEEIKKGDNFHTPIVNALTYANIIFNSVVILMWFYSKYNLLYLIESKSYLENKNSNRKIGEPVYKLKYYDKIFIFLKTIFWTNEINSFLWHVIFSSIGVYRPDLNFVYSVQLFVIINLSETLKNITRSVTMKSKQLVSTFTFMLLVCYFFASIAFFFLSENFILNMFDPKHPFIPLHAENVCGSLFYCFLTHMDVGVRWDGGIGEYLNHRNSFTYGPSYYIVRFFYEDIYFISVNFVILSIIFGIIIDAFAELRDQSIKDEKDKRDVCFICGATRESLEKRSGNFNEHVKKEHNMWTYVDYIIGLKCVDIQETNAVTSYVYEQVLKKQIAWFPSENENHEIEEGSEKNNGHGENHTAHS